MKSLALLSNCPGAWGSNHKLRKVAYLLDLADRFDWKPVPGLIISLPGGGSTKLLSWMASQTSSWLLLANFNDTSPPFSWAYSNDGLDREEELCMPREGVDLYPPDLLW